MLKVDNRVGVALVLYRVSYRVETRVEKVEEEKYVVCCVK